jgi:hypothetical protein
MKTPPLPKIARTIALAALLSCLTPHTTFAQQRTSAAQDKRVGERFNVSAVDSGMRLPAPRYGMPAVVVGDNIYVIGGSAPGGFQGDILKITPKTGTVTPLPQKLLPRRYHAAAAANGFLYVFGGVSPTDSPADISDVVERFDTRTGEVKQLAPMPTPARLAGAVTVGKKIYVIGGSDRTGKYAGTVAIYDIRPTPGAKAPLCPRRVSARSLFVAAVSMRSAALTVWRR